MLNLGNVQDDAAGDVWQAAEYRALGLRSTVSAGGTDLGAVDTKGVKKKTMDEITQGS